MADIPQPIDTVSEPHQEKLRHAHHRIDELRRFYAHFVSYILINVILFLVNLITNTTQWWWLWVALGWGVALFAHAFSVFGVANILNEKWEQRKLKELMKDEVKSRSNPPPPASL